MPSKEPLNIVVFLGSVREGRMATRVARFVCRKLEERNHSVFIIDPLALGITEVIQPLLFYSDPDEAPALLKDVDQKIRDADGFVVISSEYNSAIPPALASVMDNFPPPSYAHRPAAIISYSLGNFGGIRAASQLRQSLSDLTAIVLPHLFLIPKVNEALDENGEPTAAQQKRLLKLTSASMDQLEWYARAIRNEKKISGPPNTHS